MEGIVFRRLRALSTIPRHLILITVGASLVGLLLGVLAGWPLWEQVLVVLLPWLPVLVFEIRWTYRHYGWLALFYLLVITQTGHFVEHLCQMYQIHVMHLGGSHARGVFGQLDIEWVHFLWNTWVLVASAALLVRFRRNLWLWGVVAIAAWHQVEHSYLLSVYLSTGREATPGLLARGGVLAGGLPLSRPDLHFLYNLAETVPLLVAFVHQLRHTHDSWLAKAFPRLSRSQLVRLTPLVRTFRFPAGRTLVRQGERAERAYVLVSGSVDVVRRAEPGPDVPVATLHPGRYLGEPGLLTDVPSTTSIRARTPVEVLVLDREAVHMLAQEPGHLPDTSLYGPEDVYLGNGGRLRNEALWQAKKGMRVGS